MTSDDMKLQSFTCKGCGNCCIDASFSEVEEADVLLWRRKGRVDILKWVCSRPIGDGDYAYHVWIDPVTGKAAESCPWLRRQLSSGKYICQIHDIKPTICRYFPASRKHAEEVGCRGFQEKAGN
jgi:Fe-S-cluster containining protein